MYDTAVEEMGKVFVSTELGGGGSATARSARIARRGAENFLRHVGVLSGEPETGPSVQIDTAHENCYHFAPCDGMLEILVDLGETVETGQPLARIWRLDRSGDPPETVRARHHGLLAARHFPGLLGSGDCLAVVASVSGAD
jgi:N-alpha-acetyl-L-2,4-diaminobutyrate deacetylase